mgnify:FL=1
MLKEGFKGESSKKKLIYSTESNCTTIYLIIAEKKNQKKTQSLAS